MIVFGAIESLTFAMYSSLKLLARCPFSLGIIEESRSRILYPDRSSCFAFRVSHVFPLAIKADMMTHRCGKEPGGGSMIEWRGIFCVNSARWLSSVRRMRQDISRILRLEASGRCLKDQGEAIWWMRPIIGRAVNSFSSSPSVKICKNTATRCLVF
jgi:hypothetical protein